MVFSSGQNGKGGEKIKQNGKRKSYGFYERKRPSRDKTRPAYNKERTIIPHHQARKADEKLSYHHLVRSPQKRKIIEAAVDLPCDVSPADAEPFAEASPVAEPLSTVKLMPLELRSAKNNNNKTQELW